MRKVSREMFRVMHRDTSAPRFPLLSFLEATYSLYINDLEQHANVPGAGVSMGETKLLFLVYADDFVIFAESSEMLQIEIDKQCEYCEKWKLRLNTEKSKIIVFHKGNRPPTQQWKFGDNVLQTATAISYLGITLSSNGLMTQAQAKLADQAYKGMLSTL